MSIILDSRWDEKGIPLLIDGLTGIVAAGP